MKKAITKRTKAKKTTTTKSKAKPKAKRKLPSAPGLGIPIGTVMHFAGDIDNSWLNEQGWLFCDGSSYPTDAGDEYYNLFQVIGSAFGMDGTKFRVPDCRGLFIRGVDDGMGNDPDAEYRTSFYQKGNTGDSVGSYQHDNYAAHMHSYPNGFVESSNNWKGGGKSSGAYVGYEDTNILTGSSGGNETRPKNVYLNFIIKFQ